MPSIGRAVDSFLDNLVDLVRKLYRGLSARGGGAFGVTGGRAFRNTAPLPGRFRFVARVPVRSLTDMLDAGGNPGPGEGMLPAIRVNGSNDGYCCRCRLQCLL